MSDVEKAVIGSVLLDSNVLTLLDGVLSGPDFGDGQLAWLWDGIQGMRSRREPVDVLTVGAALAGWGIRTVSPADLHTFVSTVPHAMSVRQYARAVREDAMRRNVRQVAAQMLQTVDADPGLTLSNGINQLRDVQGAHELKKFSVTTLGDILAEEDRYDWCVEGLLERRDHKHADEPSAPAPSTFCQHSCFQLIPACKFRRNLISLNLPTLTLFRRRIPNRHNTTKKRRTHSRQLMHTHTLKHHQPQAPVKPSNRSPQTLHHHQKNLHAQ